VTVRGAGLLLGVELGGGAARVLGAVRGLQERGFLVLPAGAPVSVLCLTPPLCLTDAQIDAFAEALGAWLRSAS
jgi:4-aminobutyrate aminotransferase-like enzyme